MPETNIQPKKAITQAKIFKTVIFSLNKTAAKNIIKKGAVYIKTAAKDKEETVMVVK